MKVCKFGGTSMASASAIECVINIINSDSMRRVIVVSAPGKRDSSDVKITDALYAYHDGGEPFDGIAERFDKIAEELGVDMDISGFLRDVKRDIDLAADRNFTASRGEYIIAKLLAKKLNANFIDAAELIFFDDDGELLLEESYCAISRKIDPTALTVVPGFYGSAHSGRVRTFSRGGSDITGAIIASAIGADIYENWTDVDGFLSADPNIVRSPRLITSLTYKELRELAYMGANVLHPESIYPVRKAGIPINIRNTFKPDCDGTMIVAEATGKRKDIITGIAGRTGFTIINIEKEMMNREIGFARKVLSVLEEEGISFEHMPSGIDTLSIVVCDEYIDGKLSRIAKKLRQVTNADSIEIHKGMSLIATVGHGMASRQGTAAIIFEALGTAHINVRMIDQGSSELNIIIGVDTFDYERAIRTIYNGFIK